MISKTYLVQVMSQYGCAGHRAREWRGFGTYRAKDKREAIKQARAYNFRHGCMDGRTYGLLWWRTVLVEQNEIVAY